MTIKKIAIRRALRAFAKTSTKSIAFSVFTLTLLTQSKVVYSQGGPEAPPNLQLPFPCNQQWRLDTWAHAPALDMVRYPNQQGTEGATIVAPAAGTVNKSFYHSNGGNVIQIDHGGGWFTTYLHLQSRSVQVGTAVQEGSVIGKVGKTGPTSNNHPHLHFELGYDSNGNGEAEWGYKGSERVQPVFNGVTYGSANNQTWQKVTSHNNCSGSKPNYVAGDFDGDSKSDVVGYHPSNGSVWVGQNTGSAFTLKKYATVSPDSK